MAHRRGFGSRTPSLRRRTSWGVGPQTGVDGATQVLSASQSQIATGGSVPTVNGLTMVRTRGDLNIFLTLSDATGNGFHGAFGIGVANASAFTAGIASLLTPITDEDADVWLYHRYFGIFSGGTIAAATAAQQADQVNSASGVVHIEVDSKAMRKVSIDQVIYASIEVIELGTCVMEWAFNSRVLFKLP